jgi:hypothetical protein
VARRIRAGQRSELRHPPGTPHSPPTTAMPAITGVVGAASLGVRGLVDGPRQPTRVIAAFPSAVYLELANRATEPKVLALVAPTAARLPNAVVVSRVAGRTAAASGRRGASPGAAQPGGKSPVPAPDQSQEFFSGVGQGDEGWAGSGAAQAGPLWVPVRRWWDPSPVLGPLSRARLEHGHAAMRAARDAATRRPGLDGHPAPEALAACCAGGDLAGAVEVAEGLVGLGPGLTPSGDDVLGGLLIALRLLGGVIPGGTKAVWLADWLGAAVTSFARERTTPLSATLLHCAARGQAAAEVAAVLHGFAGQEPLVPAIRKLLATGRNSGADLAWGLTAGCRAALALLS